MRMACFEHLHADAGWRLFSFLKIVTDGGLGGVQRRVRRGRHHRTVAKIRRYRPYRQKFLRFSGKAYCYQGRDIAGRHSHRVPRWRRDITAVSSC